jgi:hypothetical protein
MFITIVSVALVHVLALLVNCARDDFRWATDSFRTVNRCPAFMNSKFLCLDHKNFCLTPSCMPCSIFILHRSLIVVLKNKSILRDISAYFYFRISFVNRIVAHLATYTTSVSSCRHAKCDLAALAVWKLSTWTRMLTLSFFTQPSQALCFRGDVSANDRGCNVLLADSAYRKPKGLWRM